MPTIPSLYASIIKRYFCSVGTRPVKVAIVGSGPAGFYTAQKILKQNEGVHVDILESLPVPFGLVRFGVAPDHPEVKNVINQFTSLFSQSRIRFIGNVTIGRDLSLNELKRLYDATVLAYGAGEDKMMNIKGEQGTFGVYSASDIVGWYNGLPSHSLFQPDLVSGDTAVVIGHGNVALDVARILLSPLGLLKSTDITEHALTQLSHSTISNVILIGRRGPLQVAFTIKELREMTKLPNCTTVIANSDISKYNDILTSLPRPRRRLTELMLKTATDDSIGKMNNIFEIKFLRSPVEILSDEQGKLTGVKLEINSLLEDGSVQGTGEYEIIQCSLLLRSIGYKSKSIDNSLPFDEDQSIIHNQLGRVVNNDSGEIEKGLYCSGWVKRGPKGVILNTMSDAFETANSIIEDINRGALTKDSNEDILNILNEKGVCTVSFNDWERIDEEERRRGELVGKQREKMTSVHEMLTFINKI